jgi:hypothetical protein
MKRRILIVVVILSLVFAIAPASASASADPCGYWANRFWLAMATNNPVGANFSYGMWLGCTIRTAGGSPA